MDVHRTADDSALKSMVGKIDELPLLPQALVRILQMDPAADDYFEQFELLAQEDPTLAVRLVALANSASSAPVTPITTLSGALTRMGTSTIRSLVASLSVQRVFVPSKPGEVRLWKHSVSVAVAAQTIARLAKSLRVDPAKAYLLGLLHDIGRFIMFEHAPEKLLKVDESHWESPEQLIEADVDIYKFTHSELGYLACKRWGLPEEISETIRFHHDPVPKTVTPGSIMALVYCTELADSLSIATIESNQLDGLDENAIIQIIQARCLDATPGPPVVDARSLAAAVDGMVKDSRSLLSGLGFN